MSTTEFSMLVKVCGVALFQVFWITGAGFLLKYFEILDKDKVRAVGRFISNVLYPCLMFSEILVIWELTAWHIWFPPFALNVIMFFISYIIVWLCRVDKTPFNLLVCLLSFPNTGALPLIFIGALKEAFVTEGKLSGDTTDYEKIFEQAVGFIMLNACIQTILRWSIGYDMMRKPQHIIDNERREAGEDVKQVASNESEVWMKIKKIMNPTLISSIVAILIASVPAAKAMFYQKGEIAPLYNTIYYPIYMIGSNGKSIMTLQLGFNLAMILDDNLSDQKELLESRHYMLNVILKMILYPFVALAVVLPLQWVGLMADPMQSFIAMLQIASPSAITLTVITNIHKFLERENAKCFIYQYIVSIVSLTLSSAFFLKLLF